MADLDEYEVLLQEHNGATTQNSKPHSNGDGAKRTSKDVHPDPSRNRKRSRSRERQRSADRSRKDRENDYRRSKSRSRSRSRGRSHRNRDTKDYRDRDKDRHRDRDRGGDWGRDRAGRDRERRPQPKRRSPTPPEVRLQRERERELKELERATRTVFAFNLNVKADERDIFEFFSKAGQVTDIRVITDRHTKRSKGLAYVEFSKQEEVFVALALTGQIMLGQPVMVKPAEAEKNLAWEAQQAAKQTSQAEQELLALGLGPPVNPAAAAAAAPAGPVRLQVTGFKKGLGENEIRQIFEPFGPIDSVSVVRDGAGVPINIAYVVFKNVLDGQNALAHWHGKSLLDHVLSVSVAPLSSSEPGAANTVGDLDDDDFKLNTQTRAALMSRLANSAGITAPAGAASNPLLAATGMMPAVLGLVPPGMSLPGMVPGVAAAMPGVPLAAAAPAGVVDLGLGPGRLGPDSPIPTPCLLLKNMFGPSEQADPGWVAELTEDVREECSRYGHVQHLYVDKDSQGFVYLKFATTEAAQAAHKVLHGRYYNGRMIQAAYQFVQTYNQHFGL